MEMTPLPGTPIRILISISAIKMIIEKALNYVSAPVSAIDESGFAEGMGALYCKIHYADENKDQFDV